MARSWYALRSTEHLLARRSGVGCGLPGLIPHPGHLLVGLLAPPRETLCLLDRFVDAPLGRIPEGDRSGCWPVTLLDPRSAADALDLGVGQPGVLVGFAEKVLAVDELEGAAPQGPEGNAEPVELLLLMLSDPADDVRFAQAAQPTEALAGAVAGSRPRHDE